MEDVVDQLFPSAYHLHFDRQLPIHIPHPNTPYQHPGNIYRQAVDYSNLPSRNPSPSTPTTNNNDPNDIFIPPHNLQPAAPSDTLDRPSNVDQIQDDTPIDEEPLYVNAKQYFRILKRRVARARLEEVHRLSKQRKVPIRNHLFFPHFS